MDRSHTTLHKYSYNQLHFTVPGMGGVENVDMSSIYRLKKIMFVGPVKEE